LECCAQSRGARGRPLKLHKTRTELAREQDRGTTPTTTTTSTTTAVPYPSQQENPSAITVKSETGAAAASVGLSALVELAVAAAATMERNQTSFEPPDFINSWASNPEMYYRSTCYANPIPPSPGSSDLLLFQYCAQIVSRAFPIMMANGRVEEVRAASVLKMWELYNYKCNTDTSLGMCDAIMRGLGSQSVNVPLVPLPDPNMDSDCQMNIDHFDIRNHLKDLPTYISQVRQPHDLQGQL